MVKVVIDRDWVKHKGIIYFFVNLTIGNHTISTSGEISRLFSINMTDYNKRTIKLAKQIGADTFPIDEDPSRVEYEEYLTFIFEEENAGKLEQFEKAFNEEFLKELVIANLQ